MQNQGLVANRRAVEIWYRLSHVKPMRRTSVQTLSQIRELLDGAGLAPRRRFGQSFLIDKNLMAKLLDLADLAGGETVLEVGPGTGSLTEELLARAARVVAVEIDRGLGELLSRRLGSREGCVLIRGDVLAGKHALSAAVRSAVGRRCALVANLPYNIATPLIAECLLESWRALRGSAPEQACRFERLTFTVQKEVADRMTAGAGGAGYGAISVLVSLLSQTRSGPHLPASAFWPQPKVAGRMVRIDFDNAAAGRISDVEVLSDVVSLAFSHRRKQMGSITRTKRGRFAGEALFDGLKAAGIDPRVRPEQVPPRKFAMLANALTAET